MSNNSKPMKTLIQHTASTGDQESKNELPAQNATTTDTEQALLKIGSEWTSPDGRLHRIYFNEAVRLELYDLRLSYYKTGNIYAAWLDGERISNSQAAKLAANVCGGKFWYDFSDGEFHKKDDYKPFGGRIDVFPELVARLRKRVAKEAGIQ
jgi:hypothetical protein